MPRVERGAEVTLVVLTYRSPRWLDWCVENTDSVRNDTTYRWLVVANDASDEVLGHLQGSNLDWINHENPDPGEFYINRVYAAWNRGVSEAKTPLVVMLNSDMAGSDYWLDELIQARRDDRYCVPTSLLVESGQIPSGMPEHVENFGLNPDEFRRAAWRGHAGTIRRRGEQDVGRLFMPILVERQEFADIGGYPLGNPPGTTGDKDLIRRYREAKFRFVTALGSVVYHAQEGETRWP